MHHRGLDSFISDPGTALAKGPVAVILAEDEIEVDTTLRHHLDLGFKSVLALMPPEFSLPPDVEARVERIDYDAYADRALISAVNQLIKAAPGIWFYYGYNAEYLFYPFCETRTIGEMLAFHAEERRDAMLTYVIDIYADCLNDFPDAVSLERAHLDRSGYYALAREDAANGWAPLERQLDFFGGLRWRYEEHIPQASRKIDRIALFKAREGLELLEGHVFNDEEYNTFACPWHHNLTAAVASFRTAKALKSNPGSRYEINSFMWHNSIPFEWHSRQLLDLGLMEPGQWF